MAAVSVSGQSLWTSAEVKMKLVDNLGGYVEGEYRSSDGLDGTQRWAGSVGLDYKIVKALKVSTGYTFIYQHEESETTKKGNIVSDYWQPKHRFTFDLTGSYDWNRFSFSLRERYQMTHRTEKSVAKYGSDGVTQKSDELIEAATKHVLRSRLEAEYNIKKSRFTPFASVEFYNSLQEGFDLKKTRYTIGSDYKLNKKNVFSLYYRYIDKSDSDEQSGHVIGVGYKFKL
jgi:hypothetical protein